MKWSGQTSDFYDDTPSLSAHHTHIRRPYTRVYTIVYTRVYAAMLFSARVPHKWEGRGWRRIAVAQENMRRHAHRWELTEEVSVFLSFSAAIRSRHHSPEAVSTPKPVPRGRLSLEYIGVVGYRGKGN